MGLGLSIASRDISSLELLASLFLEGQACLYSWRKTQVRESQLFVLRSFQHVQERWVPRIYGWDPRSICYMHLPCKSLDTGLILKAAFWLRTVLLCCYEFMVSGLSRTHTWNSVTFNLLPLFHFPQDLWLESDWVHILALPLCEFGQVSNLSKPHFPLL